MSEPFVRPDVRAHLDELAAMPRPPMNEQTIAMMRQVPPEMIETMLLQLDLPLGELGEVRDVTMPGPGGEIALRLFDVRKERTPGPVVVFFHGGGFVAGSIGTHAPLAAEISRGLDLPVVSVEYRLAPEHPWPAATDDAEAAARWIAENGAAFGREFTHLIPCGDSAGGTLTLVTTLALRDKPAALPLLMQFPIYPAANRGRKYPSDELYSDGYILSSADMEFYTRSYGADNSHWRGAPLTADLAGLPPTLLVTAALDPLRDSGRAFAAKAIEAGVQVAYREYQGTVHGFCTFRKAIPSAQADLESMLAIARAMIDEALG
jgi:acetyl esterase